MNSSPAKKPKQGDTQGTGRDSDDDISMDNAPKQGSGPADEVPTVASMPVESVGSDQGKSMAVLGAKDDNKVKDERKAFKDLSKQGVQQWFKDTFKEDWEDETIRKQFQRCSFDGASILTVIQQKQDSKFAALFGELFWQVITAKIAEHVQHEPSGSTDVGNNRIGSNEQQLPAGFQTFWKALCAADLNTVLSQGVLALGKQQYLLGEASNGSKLFIRSCYTQWFNAFMPTLKHTVLMGNPGIGKSLFLVYAMLRIVKETGKCIIYDNNMYKLFYLLLPDGSGIRGERGKSFLREQSDPNNFYLFDAGGKDNEAREPLHGAEMLCKTLVAASPDSRHFQNFMKLRTSLQYYMPIWTLTELESCRRICYPTKAEDAGCDETISVTVEDAKARFQRFGGLARFVLMSKDKEKFNFALHEKWIAGFDVRLLGVSDLAEAQARGSGISDGTNSLLLYIVDDQFWVDTKNPHQFASPYVFERLGEKYQKAGDSQLVEFVRASASLDGMGPSRGNFFEPIAHAALAHGGTFRARTPGDNNIASVTLPALTYRYFNNKVELAAAARSAKDLYLRPKSKTFPSIDSVLLPKSVCQITVDPTHTLNREGFKDALSHLGLKQSEVTVFIATTPDKFSAFDKPLNWESRSSDPLPTQILLEIPLHSWTHGQQILLGQVSKDGNDDDVDDGKNQSVGPDDSKTATVVGHCCGCKGAKCLTKACACRKAGAVCGLGSTSCRSLRCENGRKKN